jgi:hypothetical protein
LEALRAHREEVTLYRLLATLRRDVPLREGLAELEWRGPGPGFADLCRELGEDELPGRAAAVARRGPGDAAG